MGLLELLTIGATLFVPVLIIFLALKGAKMLLDLQKEVKSLSEKMQEKSD